MENQVEIGANVNRDISPFFEILDLDTGEFIRLCCYANQDTGEYDVYQLTEDGESVEFDLIKQEPVLIRKKGNIRLVYKGE